MTKARKSSPKSKPRRRTKAVEAPVSQRESVDASVRKISNGWIVSQSKSTSRGGYTSTETFSPTKPKVTLDVGVVKKA